MSVRFGIGIAKFPQGVLAFVLEEFTPGKAEPPVEVMYAAGPGNGIYHLVVRNDFETLCGLRVSRLRSDQSLHLVSDVSREFVICKHCERIQRNAETDHGQ